MKNPIIAAIAGILLAANVTFADEQPKAEKCRQLLVQAEPLYAESNYKAALPLYEEAAKTALHEHIDDAERIRCLQYLADCLTRVNQPDQALGYYERIAGLLRADDIANRIENLSHQALCIGQKGDYVKGESLVRAAEKLALSTPKSADQSWNLGRLTAQLGYFEYVQTKYPTAIKLFEDADKLIADSGRNDVTAVLLRQKMAFAQAGSYYHEKKFAEAYTQFNRVYEYCVQLYGKTDLQTGWAMMALSDVGARLDKDDEAKEWFRKAIYVFRKWNADRIVRENITKETDPAKAAEIRERVMTAIFGASKSPIDGQDAPPPMVADSNTAVNTHDPRSMYARPLTDAPGLVWMNPRVRQRGMVIAIHGLSLQHSSYDALAKILADKGYCTIAFDLRGFGTYQQALGAEQLDFDGCLSDLHHMVGSIRADHPTIPLYVLGESMGGAVALHFAAQNPALLDGLIAAMPASKRFKQGKQTLKVAVHYLGNKHRPFDIGTDVINQATKDPALKEAWGGDSKTRGTISAKELLAFQLMCNHNLANAKVIRKTPVIMFQGMQDGLIKPDATYDLYRAISAKDKTLWMAGDAEHLIFEEGCFTPTIVEALVAWMDTHGKPESDGQ